MDIFPKCSVCQQQFTLKGPHPYLLPCLHAVCETCVTSAVGGVTSAAGGVISCRACHREVNLTEASLQKDEVGQQEIFHLAIKHCPTELLCAHADDGNQAVCWCQECEELLCEHCQNMHSSFNLSRNHPVYNLGDIAPQTLVCETNCRVHNRYVLDLFDKSCNTSICSRCLKGEHGGHEVEDLDEAALAGKQRTEQRLKDLSSLLSEQQTHLKSIRQDIQLTDRTQNTLKGTIADIFQSIRSKLDQREKELLIDLDSQTKETTATLRALQTSCEDEHARCKEVSGYIRKCLLYASKSALLKLESCVEGVTRTFLETASPQAYDVSTAVFNINGLSKVKRNMSRFGIISALKGETGGDNSGVSDKETQTDDSSATLKQKHEMELAEMKIKFASDKERLQQITDKLNVESSSMRLMLVEKERSFEAASETIDRLQTFLKSYPSGGCVHLLKTGLPGRHMVLHCIPLKYDKDRVNLDKVNINAEGDLINRKSDTGLGREGRLKKYWGTCSTEPLPQDGCSQYWEVENSVSLDKPLSENLLILEVGVCREEQRDVRHYIDGPCSYCMVVSQCPTHVGICRKIRKEGKYVMSLPDALPNTAGASHTLHYGVVVDDARKKIVFLDLKEKKVMSALDNVDCNEPLWPMFGVYIPVSGVVRMRLVVGNDINMTEEKKAMIVQVLK